MMLTKKERSGLDTHHDTRLGTFYKEWVWLSRLLAWITEGHNGLQNSRPEETETQLTRRVNIKYVLKMI